VNKPVDGKLKALVWNELFSHARLKRAFDVLADPNV